MNQPLDAIRFRSTPEQMSTWVTKPRMTKSIQQVQQNLNNLESTAAEIAIELEQLHREYLEMLAQLLKQQLILTCYQICTQLYPRSFLDLSLREKQDLQQKLRQLGNQLEPELIEIVRQKELESEPTGLNLMAELIKNLPKSKSKDDPEAAEIDLELVKAELENIEFIEIATPPEDPELETLNQEPDSGSSPTSLPLSPAPEISSSNADLYSEAAICDFENPEHLILWHKQIERNIKKTLDTTSRKINKCLQESKILPDRIPSKVIDVAMQADSSKGMRNFQQPNIPHILQLAIENAPEGKSKSSKNAVQISLLRLRLAELEFNNPLLNAKRGQIRNLMSKIKQLNRQYKATKREAEVIEAQAAWRSSWYED